MASSNWIELLKSQNEEINRLEAVDHDIDNNVMLNLNDEINNIIKKKSSSFILPPPAGDISGAVSGDGMINEDHYSLSIINNYDNNDKTIINDDNKSNDNNNTNNNSSSRPSSETKDKRKSSSSSLLNTPNALDGSGVTTTTPRTDVSLDGKNAPETANRMMKAKYAFMTKQVDSLTELKKKMEEQNRDLQKQLNLEREEKKNLQKRVTILESDVRKNTRRVLTIEEGNNVDNVASLQLDVDGLKRDLSAAQRLIKQVEDSAKTKDSQLKRAAETISRLKSQLAEANSHLHEDSTVDKTKLNAAENKIKILEKQRSELIEGFRKQLKLIDILKRQKVHIEAARLLSFTEDEFMKTLDWKV